MWRAVGLDEGPSRVKEMMWGGQLEPGRRITTCNVEPKMNTRVDG